MAKAHVYANIAGGLALATGRFPRLAALGLAANLVPTTLVGHAYWSAPEDQKTAQKINFFKNISLLGGLLLAAADTGGRESIPHAVSRVSKRATKRPRRRAEGQQEGRKSAGRGARSSRPLAEPPPCDGRDHGSCPARRDGGHDDRRAGGAARGCSPRRRRCAPRPRRRCPRPRRDLDLAHPGVVAADGEDEPLGGRGRGRRAARSRAARPAASARSAAGRRRAGRRSSAASRCPRPAHGADEEAAPASASAAACPVPSDVPSCTSPRSSSAAR